MADAREWEAWSPAFAPHVKGRYTRRVYDSDARMHEEQTVEAVCEHVDPTTGARCGATWRTRCASGRVREHIATFGRVHLHADPIGSPPPAARR